MIEKKELLVKENNIPIYKILLEQNFKKLKEELLVLGYGDRKILIVTESNVAPLYLDAVINELQDDFSQIHSFVFEAGEKQKNLETVSSIYTELIQHQFDRKDLLIALGGGVTGDLTGFAASTYLRGIAFIQVPTTLLSQVDSSIGGKTGVDYLNYKNMVGAFYQPKLVYINISTLNTLSDKEFYSGLGEVIKHGLIKDKKYFHWITQNKESIYQRNYHTLSHLIYQSCFIKGNVVERDPKEQGERALLNFGHTLGHAIEKLANFSIPHGDCVVIGSKLACYISWKKGYLSDEEYQQSMELLSAFPFHTLPKEMNSNAIIAATKLDKKMEQGVIKFILLKGIGNAIIDKSVTEDEMLESLIAMVQGEINE